MSSEPSLLEDLEAYREAAGTEDDHALAARRRRLLPGLRSDGGKLSSAADLRTAIAVLAAAKQAAFGPLPPGDATLEQQLAERLAGIPADSYRVPVLLVDEGSGEGVVGELVVELTEPLGIELLLLDDLHQL